jgi:protein-tyrosine kinase
MPDHNNRKNPADRRLSAFPPVGDELYSQHSELSDHFADGPDPAQSHEFIDAEAATRVSNYAMQGKRQKASLPAPPVQSGWSDGGPHDTGWQPDSTGIPYTPGYFHDPGIGDAIPASSNVAYNGTIERQPENYGLALREPPPDYDAQPAGHGAYSWIRENAADHVGPPSPDLVLLSNADGRAASQFRALRYRLEQEPGVQVVVVTSPREGDGKSVTAANLALSLAEGGRIRVLLIDAALRSPSQHKLFGIRGDLGLTTVLAARQNDPSRPIDVIRISTSLALIPAGPPVQSAYAALSSEPAAVLLDQIRREYRYIIVDGSPVFGTAETLAWHTMVDKYIVVARAGRSTTEDLSRACDRLQRERILGVTFVGASGGHE